MAALYGVPAPTQMGTRLVRLPPSAQRFGLLSHASILSLTAHPTASSPTLRGKFVRSVLLCHEIPPPPVGVNTAIPEVSSTARTLRERVAVHLEEPSCGGCHRLLDLIGLGLENYDALGQWRTQDNEVDIDASGEVDGVTFQDPKTLSKALRDHPNVGPCFVQTITRYALGRVLTDEEDPLIDELASRFAFHRYRVRALLLELVISPLFSGQYFEELGADQ